jgi:DNA-binding MarR family transcriptional regulator
MVKIIDYLIKSGIVDRNVNPQDRREHFIVLTKKGIRQAEDVDTAFNTLDEKMFGSVTKEEKQIFEKVLDKLMLHVVQLPANDLFFTVKTSGRKKKKTATALS